MKLNGATGSHSPFKAEKLDAVILSHAPIDHSGRLPLLGLMLAWRSAVE